MRKRGRKNEGFVYFHKGSKRWCANFTVKNHLGKSIPKRVYCKLSDNSERAAAALLFDLRVKANDNELKLDNSFVLSFLEEWLEISKPNIRQSTYVDYAMTIKRYIKPFLGNIKLQGLDEMMLENLYSELEKNGISPRQRKKAHALIRAALSKALRWRKVSRNVAAGIDAPKYKSRPIQPLTDEQTKALILAAQGSIYLPLFHLALDTGMRQGEIFGLWWSDIDFRASRIKIERSLSEVGGKMHYELPKTASGARTVDISETVLNELLLHRKAQFAKGLSGSGLVFPSTTGKPIWKKSFHKNFWAPVLANAGLKIRFHDLRHTAAVRMLERGLDPEVVRDRLGHASISVTLGIYAHVTSKQRRQGAATYDQMLSEA